MKYAESIEAALENSGTIEMVDGEWIPAFQEAELDMLPNIEADDKSPFVFPAPDSFKMLPHIVYTDSADRLRQIVEEFFFITGVFLRTSPDEAIVHEIQHAEVTKNLGGSSLFGLAVYSSSDKNINGYNLVQVPVNLSTTKIGAAVIGAFPEEPSANDIYLIQSMGYESVDKVGEVASKYNLPLPLSYRTNK